MLWVSRIQRKTLIQDGDTKSYFSNMLLKLFDVWTDLSHFSPWKCCFYNGYTSCKYYFIHLAVFLWKKSLICYHFDWLLSKTIETDPNLLYFSFFLQVGAWKVYQSTVKVLPTTHKHQRNTNCTGTLCFMVEFDLTFQATAHGHILQLRSLRLHTDMRLLIGKWWPEPRITNMAQLLYHLACIWSNRYQLRGYKFVSESARFIQKSQRIWTTCLALTVADAPQISLEV